MGGETLLEKLKEEHYGLINLNVANFPVITHESFASKIHYGFFGSLILSYFVLCFMVINVFMLGANM